MRAPVAIALLCVALSACPFGAAEGTISASQGEVLPFSSMLGEESNNKCTLTRCEPSHFVETKTCTCKRCTEGTAGMTYEYKHCDIGGNVVDTKLAPCSTCEDGSYESVKCGPTQDTQCRKCTRCCPVEGEAGSGIECKAYKTKCDSEKRKDNICGLPHDFKAYYATGKQCGKRCGKEVGDQFSSKGSWAFIITDRQGKLVFQGLPNVTTPDSSGALVPLGATGELGISSGYAPRTVVVTPSLNAPLDSWCMESFCMDSKSAGVKFEYNPKPIMNKANNAKGSLWMNPNPSGPCGGITNQWKFELVGPLKGTCSGSSNATAA